MPAQNVLQFIIRDSGVLGAHKRDNSFPYFRAYLVCRSSSNVPVPKLCASVLSCLSSDAIHLTHTSSKFCGCLLHTDIAPGKRCYDVAAQLRTRAF